MREERTDWRYEPSVRTPTTRAKTSEPPEIFPGFFGVGRVIPKLNVTQTRSRTLGFDSKKRKLRKIKEEINAAPL